MRNVLAVLALATLLGASSCGNGTTSLDISDPGRDTPVVVDAPDLVDVPIPADLPADTPSPDLAPEDLVVDSTPDVPGTDDSTLDTPDALDPDVADESDAGTSDTNTPDEPDGDASPPDTPADDTVAPDPYGPAGTPLPIVGFGEGTLGGDQPDHDTYHVTSLADDGPGTLREGLRTDSRPRVVLFDVDGVIALAAPLIAPSNITIDARDHDVTLRGKGLVIPGSDQVIVANLAFEDVGPDSEDGVQIGSAAPDPSEFIVLDHLRFTQHGDGGSCKNVDEAISVVFGSRNITIAWCRFESWEKILLAGNGDADPALDAQITVTMHHCHARDTGRRHPQARYGRYHMLNNFLEDWHMYGSVIDLVGFESFGSQIQDNGRMLLEGQMVRRKKHSLDLFTQANQASRCESGGDLLEHGTWKDPATTADLSFGVGCAMKEAFVPPYAVTVETAGPALRDRVVAGAGNTLHP